jgi:hypothetical protein
MDEIKFGLSDMEISDDLNVSLNNDEYQDQANPAPPAYGDYLLRLLSSDGSKTKDSITPAIYRAGEKKGQQRFKTVNGVAFPVLNIGVVEIVEGLGDGVTRKVGLFQDIETNPYEREGKEVSQLGDFARSLGLPNYSGIGEAVKLLAEAQQSGAMFGATLDWESGYDKAFVDAAFEQLDLPRKYADQSPEQAKLANTINRWAKVTGMRNFPYNAATGRFSHIAQRGNVVITDPNTKNKVTIEVPSRTLGEARAVLKVDFRDIKFISRERVDSGRVVFGPKTVTPAKAAAAA